MTKQDRLAAERNTESEGTLDTQKPKVIVVEYRLDECNRITEVNEAWRRFAIDNGGGSLLAENVIGRPLHEFISGDITRMFVSALLQATRLTGQTRTVHYRCDSAETKRYMAMDIVPISATHLISRHRVLRELKLAVSTSFTAQKAGQKTLIKRCSMCNRVTRNGAPPMEPEHAGKLGWLNRADDTLVIYFVCRECKERVEKARTRA